jgi:hypothetical protein
LKFMRGRAPTLACEARLPGRVGHPRESQSMTRIGRAPLLERSLVERS